MYLQTECNPSKRGIHRCQGLHNYLATVVRELATLDYITHYKHPWHWLALIETKVCGHFREFLLLLYKKLYLNKQHEEILLHERECDTS